MAYDPEYHRAYYRKNREKKLAESNERAASRKKEKAEYDRARREADGESMRAYDKERYLKVRRWSVDYMFHRAKSRAAKKGIPFSITKDDIIIPVKCPALGIPLFGRSGSGYGENSPSLDKIIPHLGYVPGNVIVISGKANMIKCNASPQEIYAVARWLEETLKERPIPPAVPRS